MSPLFAKALFKLNNYTGASFVVPQNSNIDNNLLLTGQKVNANQCKSVPPLDREWGIDTVNVWFYVNLDECEMNPSCWSSSSSGTYADSKKEYAKYELNLEFGHTTVKVILDTRKGVCKLRFNASRLLTGKSRQLLHPDALKPLVNVLLNHLSSHVWPVFDQKDEQGTISRDLDWPSQVKISRLDPARNLFVEDFHTLKQVLIHTKAKNGKLNQLIWDDNYGWTFCNKTKSQGSDRFYDKSAELNEKGFEASLDQTGHWFRFEIQLEKERLKRHGFFTLADISDERIWEALEIRWLKCGWGVALPEPNKLGVVLAGLSNGDQSGLLALLSAQALGLKIPMSAGTATKFRKLALQHGLTPGMALNQFGPATGYLSLHEGKVVSFNTDVSEASVELA